MKRTVISKTIVGLALVAVCCLGAAAGEERKGDAVGRWDKIETPSGQPVVPLVDIPLLAEAPVIDGEMKPDEWGKAAKTEAFLGPKTTTPAVPSTHCWMGMDARNLYLAFRCGLEPGATPKAGAKQRDGNVWEDDSVELFIWPDGAKPSFVQFIFNSIGTGFDSKYSFDVNTLSNKGQTNWNPSWEARTGKVEGAWILEVAIPWSTLELEPTGMRGLRLNCCRNAIPGRDRLSSWAYLPKPSFQSPDCFGIGLCSWGAPRDKWPDPATLHLGMLGLLRIERTSGVFPPTGSFTATCALAVPRHSLFEDLRIQVTPEVVPLDLDGKEGAPLLFSQWGLARGESGRLEFGGLENVNFKLKLRFGGGFGLERTFVVLDKAVRGFWQRFEKIPLRELAQKEPFKAGAVLGAAACAEKLKVALEPPGDDKALQMLREVVARLDIIEAGTSAYAAGGLLGCLNLAKNPDAQVVVEYSQDRRQTVPSAGVTFYWGAIPMVSVRVEEFDSKEKAEARLGNEQGPLKYETVTTFEGQPAKVSSRCYIWSRFQLSDFDAVRQVLLFNPKKGAGIVLDAAHLDCASVVAASLLDDCPQTVRSAVEKWAQTENIPVQGLDDALQKDDILVAGGVTKIAEKLKVARVFSVQPQKSTRMQVAMDKRLYTIWSCPSRELAEKAMRFVMAGKPVSVDDADALRRLLVRDLAPKDVAGGAAPEAARRLFCGDLHMHTFYSDGYGSPVMLALQTMYCNMDFAVMTDHQTLEGAQLARRVLGAHGFDYPLIVGEEVTTKWAHLNAYPLTKVIPETLSPEETVKAAHEQGAVIQWNHPGYTNSEFEMSHMATGLVGTGCDAWEHYTAQYEGWREKGGLPVFVGGTDTHSGTFDDPERTIVMSAAPRFDGNDLADAIRRGDAVMVSLDGGRYLYGADKMTTVVWKALADGKALKDAKAARLQAVLKNADLLGLLKEKPRQ